MDERIAGQLTLLSFYRRYVIAETLTFPGAALAANEHKNPDFVLEKPENGGPEGEKSSKTPILCSKR